MTIIIDGTGTISGVSATGLTTAQTVGYAQLPTGSVLQVVSASTTAAVSNSTVTYVDTGLTATITPKFATSKILVIVSQQCYKSAGNASSGVNITLLRNATDFGRMVYAQGYTSSAIEQYLMAAFQYFDSPASTSALTYKTQFANNTNAAAAAVQADSIGRSTITLMEIAV